MGRMMRNRFGGSRAEMGGPRWWLEIRDGVWMDGRFVGRILGRKGGCGMLSWGFRYSD